MPSVLLDLHEMGGFRNGLYYFSPGDPNRTYKYIPQENQDLTKAISQTTGRYLDSIGVANYTGRGYDDFFIGNGIPNGFGYSINTLVDHPCQKFLIIHFFSDYGAVVSRPVSFYLLIFSSIIFAALFTSATSVIKYFGLLLMLFNQPFKYAAEFSCTSERKPNSLHTNAVVSSATNSSCP